MAWTIGICLLAVVLFVWALCLSAGHADDQLENWFRPDGDEPDLPDTAPLASRAHPALADEPTPTPLHEVLEDLARRVAVGHAHLPQPAEARPRRRPHRPFWEAPDTLDEPWG